MMFDNFIKSVFEGYNDSPSIKERQRSRLFDELEWYPMLFSSNHLNQVFDQAKSKEDHEAILDYLYRFNATEVESYANLEQKIIDIYHKPEPAKLYFINGGKKR